MAEGPKYNVIFRTTEAVRGVARPFGLDMRMLIKACFLSLYEAVKPFPYSIHVLGDKLSEDLSRAFLSALPFEYRQSRFI